MKKSRRIELAGHVAFMREIKLHTQYQSDERERKIRRPRNGWNYII
jgi:hypothetical protein